MSRYVSEEKWDSLKTTMLAAIRYVISVFLPMTILVIIFSDYITEVLFARGQFDSTSVLLTSTAIRMYAIGITAVALRDIFFNYFYAVKNSTFTFTVSLIGIFINVLINFALVSKLGIGGLALGTSISAIAVVPVFIFKINKDLNFEQTLKVLVQYILKCLACSVVPSLVLVLYNIFVHSNNFIILFIIVAVYFVTYLTCLKAMKIEEADIIIGFINKFLPIFRNRSNH